MRKILFLSLSSLLACLVIITSCKKKKTNEALYNESKASDLVFYKNKDTVYGAKGTSPHGSFKLKFNTIALAAFVNGKLPQGESFPTGSLIVKEVYNGNALTLYAVMKKDAKSKFASSKWVWAEYKPNGDVVYDASKRGDACVSCHSASGNRDLSLSFDLH